MLHIVIPSVEYYDDINNEFVVTKEYKLQLEHSLVSISKWEAKWQKPFLHTERTLEETLDYIRCMTITQNIPEEAYYFITKKLLAEIEAYMDSPMTATKIYTAQSQGGGVVGNRRVVTSELIYHWMVSLNIPFECQKWHINRLITLIRVCDIENNPKKMGAAEAAKHRQMVNRARRQKFNSKG